VPVLPPSVVPMGARTAGTARDLFVRPALVPLDRQPGSDTGDQPEGAENVILKHYREVARSDDQKVIEAFAAQGANPALRNGVRLRCPDRGCG
jgi:hypothetical protein